MKTLSEIYEEGFPFSRESGIQLALQLIDGFESIHESGLLSSLSEEGIYLDEDGKLKVRGFSSAAIKNSVRIVDVGPPEFDTKGAHDVRTDIYWLSVLSYEILTGDPPFKGESVYEVVKQRKSKIFLKSDPIFHSCPEPLAAAIVKGMSADPGDRPTSIREFKDDAGIS